MLCSVYFFEICYVCSFRFYGYFTYLAKVVFIRYKLNIIFIWYFVNLVLLYFVNLIFKKKITGTFDHL